MVELGRDFLGINGAVELTLSGDHLWALKTTPSYRVFDVSDPSDPVFVADVAMSSRVWDLEVAGTLGYFLTNSALAVYDVTNPASPSLLGSTPVSGNARRLTLTGDLAVVTTLSTLEVFDVS
jgi:hypothetical protein